MMTYTAKDDFNDDIRAWEEAGVFGALLLRTLCSSRCAQRSWLVLRPSAHMLGGGGGGSCWFRLWSWTRCCGCYGC